VTKSQLQRMLDCGGLPQDFAAATKVEKEEGSDGWFLPFQCVQVFSKAERGWDAKTAENLKPSRRN
jgi:hypothetical protein